MGQVRPSNARGNMQCFDEKKLMSTSRSKRKRFICQKQKIERILSTKLYKYWKSIQYRSNMRHKWPYLRTKMVSVLAKKHFSICTIFSEVQSTLSWNFWDRKWCYYLSFVRLNIHLSKVIKTFSQGQLLKCIRPLKWLLLNFGIF